MITARRAVTALLLVSAAGGCNGFGSRDDSTPPGPGGEPQEGAKAPPISGTADQSELTEEFGVFVSPRGQTGSAGSRERPVATIQAGIDLGKRLGKRVYVCTGSFQEALVLADSISIIGGLDCSGSNWRLGAPRSRIEAPTSPAVRATDIASATRLEGLDIVAPSAAAPSASSIGLLAVHAAGLVIGGSKITAGDGANGSDGSEGIQLTQQGSVNGGSLPAAKCILNDTCKQYGFQNKWTAMPAPGGTSVCAGAPGHDGLPGGFGGPGGLYRPAYDNVPTYWATYADAIYGASAPGSAGADGTDGTPGVTLGTFSKEGYVAPGGGAGTDGTPGNGGRGGRGGSAGLPAAGSVFNTDVWRAATGDGGGAGGCPGLAGAPGTGGGASVALALVESPVVLDGAEIVAGRAGGGGRGAFGSAPTVGGVAGTAWSTDPIFTGRSGGRGGRGGVSTNGSGGPSVSIVHSGAAPTIGVGTRLTPGPGGAAIDARSLTDAFGTRTVPATPAGLSKDILAF